jgi:hypothetical protein
MAVFCIFMLWLFSFTLNYIDDNASKNLDNIKMTWEESRILLEGTDASGADNPVDPGDRRGRVVLQPVEQGSKKGHG